MRIFFVSLTCVIFSLVWPLSVFSQQSTPLAEGVKSWTPGNSPELYGGAVAACDAMFYSISANDGLMPNAYNYGFDSSGNPSTVSCAQYGEFGGFSGGTTGHASLACPEGTNRSGDDNQCSLPQNAGEDCGGNPISILNGEKIATETDFIVGRGRLRFVRSYKSLQSTYFAGALGAKWDSNFHPIVRSHYSGFRGNFIYRTPGGRLLRFQKENGSWRHGGLPFGGNEGWYSRENRDRKDLKGYRIEQLADFTILITTPDNVVRSFAFNPPPTNGSATLIGMTSVEYPDGYKITLNYGGSDLVQSVTDTDGYTLQFAYSDRDLLESVTAPDGTVYEYEYIEFGQSSLVGNSQFLGNAWQNFSVLSKVIYPDDTPGSNSDNPNKTYDYADKFYEGAQLGRSSFLTGITDERGIKINEWEYAFTGPGTGIRAIASRGANGVEETLIEQITPRSEYRLVNAKGKESIYHYIDTGSILKLDNIEGLPTSNCAASSMSRDYDSDGYRSVSVDAEGQRREVTYDPVLGLPTQIINGAGTSEQETTSIIWDQVTRKPASIERPGLRADFTYDSDWNITNFQLTDTTLHSAPYSTNGVVRSWAYAWSAEGLLQSVDGPLSGAGDTVSFAYDANGNPASITNELGHITNINAVDGMGRPTQITDPNGLSTDLTYTPRGWISSIVQSGGSITRTTVFGYDETGNLTNVTLPNGGTLAYTYNDSSWLTQVTSSTGDTITYQHDLLGNITREDRLSGGSAASSLTMQYDDLGRLTQSLGGAGDLSIYGYDRSDRQTSMTDGLGRNWLTAFDALNRVISETDPQNDTTGYTWEQSGEVQTYSDARNFSTQFTRNGFGEVIREISPDRGTTDFWRDEAGRVTQRQSAAGQVVLYSYDVAGRLLSRIHPAEMGVNVIYAYDTSAGNSFGTGKLTRVTGGINNKRFRYNQFGDLTRQTIRLNGKKYQVKYNYLSDGRLRRVTLPSGNKIRLTMDSLGRSTRLQFRSPADASFRNIVSSASYRSFGPLGSYNLGNGSAVTHTHDASYRLTSIHLATGASTLLSKAYGYDANSRVTSISDGLDGAVDASFTYHSDGRLDRAIGAWGDTAWEYDPVGNRIEAVDIPASGPTQTSSYTYPADSNRLSRIGTSGQSGARVLAYTDNGHIRRDKRANGDIYRYVYSQSDRLKRVRLNGATLADYKYDAFGHRVRRSLPDGTLRHFVFSTSGILLGEYDGTTGAVITEYLWFDGMLVAKVDGAGVITYVQTGHLGQPLALVDEAGTVIWRGEMSPFGTYVSTSGIADTPDLRLPGQWLEASSGLFHNWHRDYDPSLGRYIEADPLGIAAGQSVYGYVGQDPLNAVDPTGLIWETLWDAANVAFSLGRAAGFGLQGQWGEAGDELGNAALDTVAMCTPGVPAGAGAGRRISRGKSKKSKKKNDDDCDEEWQKAYVFCAALPRNNSKYRELWGGDFNRCVRGQVSQRCGGNRVEW